MTVPSSPETSGEQRDLRAELVRAARAELVERGSAALSLRAVARRAGVSHAAPAYAFGDRAGLLTAVAADGYTELASVMDAPAPHGPREAVAELGRRYVDFARRHPALYDLMFRPDDLRDDDHALQTARAASLRALAAATAPGGGPPVAGPTTLVCWAFAHRAATLVRLGALPADPDAARHVPAMTTDALVEHFATLVVRSSDVVA